MQGGHDYDKSPFGETVAALSGPAQTEPVMGTGGQAVPAEDAGRSGFPALAKPVQRPVTAGPEAGAALHAG